MTSNTRIAHILEDVAQGLERDLWIASEPGGYYEPVANGEEQHSILTPAEWVRNYSAKLESDA